MAAPVDACSRGGTRFASVSFRHVAQRVRGARELYPQRADPKATPAQTHKPKTTVGNKRTTGVRPRPRARGPELRVARARDGPQRARGVHDLPGLHLRAARGPGWSGRHTHLSRDPKFIRAALHVAQSSGSLARVMVRSVPGSEVQLRCALDGQMNVSPVNTMCSA